jgi:hypothetical protein
MTMKIALLRENRCVQSKRTGGILTSYVLNDDERVPNIIKEYAKARNYTLLVHPVNFKLTPEMFLRSVIEEIDAWEEY